MLFVPHGNTVCIPSMFFLLFPSVNYILMLMYSFIHIHT